MNSPLAESVIDRMAEALWTYENHDGEWRHYEGGPVGDRLRAQAQVLLNYATGDAMADRDRLREALEALMTATYVLLRSTIDSKPAGHFDAWRAADAADKLLEAHNHA